MVLSSSELSCLLPFQFLLVFLGLCVNFCEIKKALLFLGGDCVFRFELEMRG